MNSGIFFVYAIVSKKDNRIYVGISQNVDKRIIEHNNGKVFSTKPFIPWLLFHSELAGKAEEARKKEKYFKTAAGKKRLRKVLKSLNSGSLPD
ncbi:MAG: GIY-YIG nuclease family protein [Bacteroidia bacterium]|nr:GIY-YIG nuclease family protein [Bacteroidia bacterium]